MKCRNLCWIVVTLVFVGLAVPSAQAFGKDKKKDEKKTAQAPKSDADFGKLMNDLTTSLNDWDKVSPEDKTKSVQAVIDLYKLRDNSAILRPADLYVKKLDDMLASNPDMKTMSLPGALKMLAVMDYDFYNGENKDELAKKTLGDRMYEVNKERIKAKLQMANLKKQPAA